MDGGGVIRRVFPLTASALVVAAVLVHAPGHLSMDSSLQVYEAQTGRSVSWAPPFMSALLRWFGGGPEATTVFVALCATFTYGGFVLALRAAQRIAIGPMPWSWLRTAAAGVLLLNPIVFLHVGIIWKDVLFASQLALALGLMCSAASHAGATRAIRFAFALLVLLPSPLVRQHGVLLAPILALPCMYGIATAGVHASAMRRAAVLVVTAAVSLGMYIGIDAAVKHTIEATDGKSTSVGVVGIARYDMTGMIAAGMPLDALPAPMREPAFVKAARRTYTPDRIDFVLADPVVVAGYMRIDETTTIKAWLQAIRSEPVRYAGVKGEQYAWLLGFHRLDRCLPIHLGIEGMRGYLVASGFSMRKDKRDEALFGLSMFTRHLALYRHWFYVVVLLACAGVAFGWRRRMAGIERAVLASTVAAAVVLYASFFPTVLACDFRYLYPGIVMVSLLALYLLARPAGMLSSFPKRITTP